MLRTSQKQSITEFNLLDYPLSTIVRRDSLRRAQARTILRHRKMKRWNKVIDWILTIIAMAVVGFVLGQAILVGHLDVYTQPTTSWHGFQNVFFELIHKVCTLLNIQ
jgi:hypothetical protein